MKSAKHVLLSGMLAAAVMAVAPSTPAQVQTTGTPGSPGATTTIDGRYLPPPQQQFHGDIQPNAYQSKPYWPALVTPPKGAPNVAAGVVVDQATGYQSQQNDAFQISQMRKSKPG
jgi:hypothetical protein